MKILTLCNVPADPTLGSGYGILNYAAQLRRLGHTVELHDAEAAALFPGFSKGRGYRLALGMLLLAWRRLRGEKWDIVEFWGAEAWLAISVLSRWPRRDFLIVHHSNGIEPHAYEAMRKATGYANFEGIPPRWFQVSHEGLLVRAFTRCDALVTLSEFDRAYALEKNYLPPGRVLAIETPLATPFVGAPLPPKQGRRLGFCGMWIRRKGADALAEAVPRLLREFPEWGFRIIGPGPGADPLRDFPEDVRDRIEVIPFLRDREALRRAYEEIDVFLVPSLYESFGVVAIEAMAAGAALVMTRTGIGTALRHGEEALILPHVSASLLYEAAKRLIEDPSLRAALQQAGHRRVQSGTWNEAGNILEAHYRRWLDEWRGERSGSR